MSTKTGEGKRACNSWWDSNNKGYADHIVECEKKLRVPEVGKLYYDISELDLINMSRFEIFPVPRPVTVRDFNENHMPNVGRWYHTDWGVTPDGTVTSVDMMYAFRDSMPGWDPLILCEAWNDIGLDYISFELVGFVFLKMPFDPKLVIDKFFHEEGW